MEYIKKVQEKTQRHEHRLSKDAMEEQVNKEAQEGWRFAADAARITDERADSENQKHTSGGVFEAVDNNLGAVVGEKEGAVMSIPGNAGQNFPGFG